MNNPPGPLPEKEFIHEGYSQDPKPFWFWLIILTAFVLLLGAGYSWYAHAISNEYRNNPFLQVTNREMSLFLWQNPEFMRINAPAKSAYMPGFQYTDKVSLEVPFADDYVIAPPEVLFRYHTWHRLISKEFPQRLIPPGEFAEFLNYAEEWQPDNWPQAPKNYATLVKNLYSYQNLAPQLPKELILAFQGWKNYFLEGAEINALNPSIQQVRTFLNAYPHYARNYWRNITGVQYLSSLSQNPDTILPANELSPFLRVALYNFLQVSKEDISRGTLPP